MFDPLTRLADLPSTDLDPARAERIRSRCHARLARQRTRTTPARDRVAERGRVRAWQPAIVVLAVGYFAEVIVQALRVYNLR
jgi:anti-sigma-K factor RskA